MSTLVERLRDIVSRLQADADDEMGRAGASNDMADAANYACDELRSVIEALEAEREWRPIDTAPKDATRIIVTDGLGVYGWAWWNETEGVWLNCDGCHPTHWQPLPTPPQTGGHVDA